MTTPSPLGTVITIDDERIKLQLVLELLYDFELQVCNSYLQDRPGAFDREQLAAVCRIKALRRLRCCALPVCGFGQEGA
jgi:hypothetical protein